MSLTTPQEIAQTWGSHVPLLTAVLEKLPHLAVVECGAGKFSTPLLRQHVPYLLTVEHDAHWAQKMLQTCPQGPGHRWVLHKLSGDNGTPLADLPDWEVRSLVLFYQELGGQLPHCDLLFVDTYRSARVPAILHLSAKSDVVMVHDLEPGSPEWYNYALAKGALVGRFKYLFRPEGYVAQVHRIPWTALYSKNPLPVKDLQEVCSRESQALWGFDARLEEVPND